MKKNNKIVCIICLLLLLTGSVHASTQLQGDCGIVLNGFSQGKSLLEGAAQAGTPGDTEALNLAVEHLGAYCCTLGSLPGDSPTCKEADANREKYRGGAESPFLFDHLINIGFRRLDADEKSELRFDLSADPAGEKRKKTIKELENPDKPHTPQQISDAFNDQRTVQTSVDIDNQSCKVLTPYSSLPLSQKYSTACHIAACQSQKVLKVSSNASDSSANNSPLALCEAITTRRIMQEIDEMKIMQVRIGSRNLDRIIQNYSQQYFIDTRRSSLYEIFTEMNQNLSFVNQKIQEGTPVCTK